MNPDTFSIRESDNRPQLLWLFFVSSVVFVILFEGAYSAGVFAPDFRSAPALNTNFYVAFSSQMLGEPGLVIGGEYPSSIPDKQTLPPEIGFYARFEEKTIRSGKANELHRSGQITANQPWSRGYIWRKPYILCPHPAYPTMMAADLSHL
ncbi:MAG: hypothetical protein HY537_06840 [Deltaproteobacteria bacterium]|nr:hypothetical protein [Deltaproteobacteria bacterium]